MRSRKRTNGRDQMLRLALLTAIWMYTRVSLLDLIENAIELEKPDRAGVGVRIVTNGSQDRIMRYSERDRSSITIASYYINFGSTRKAQELQRTLRQAIGLCKAQQSEKRRV